jgi:hypothetical protein
MPTSNAKVISSGFTNLPVEAPGLTSTMVHRGIEYTYEILTAIDNTLISRGAFRLSQMMELANLSTFVGNLLGAGIAKASDNFFTRNGPHKYPDLLAKNSSAKDIEIKVAIEDNKPKGHLAKPGYYLTCRYVLCNSEGKFTLGERGDIVWIWEVRSGLLDQKDFNLSNTAGDSGKTAVVNKEGMEKLKVIYCDLERLPYSPRGKTFKKYQGLFTKQSKLF